MPPDATTQTTTPHLLAVVRSHLRQAVHDVAPVPSPVLHGVSHEEQLFEVQQRLQVPHALLDSVHVNKIHGQVKLVQEFACTAWQSITISGGVGGKPTAHAATDLKPSITLMLFKVRFKYWRSFK